MGSGSSTVGNTQAEGNDNDDLPAVYIPGTCSTSQVNIVAYLQRVQLRVAYVEESGRFRQEQDMEYQRSLEIDRQKVHD